MKYLNKTTILLALLSTYAIADDTEIFTGGGTGGNTNLMFLIDTSGSMTAWADGEDLKYDNDGNIISGADPIDRPPYDPSFIYDNDVYGFDPDAYYVYDLPGNNSWNISELENWQLDELKDHQISIDALNCSLASNINSALNNYGTVTGTFAFFAPGQGWGTGNTNTNSGTILQCQESEGEYSYESSLYQNMVNGRGYDELNFPYTNADTVDQEQCTEETVFIGTKWYHIFDDDYWVVQEVCETSQVNITYNWTNDAYNAIFSGNYLNYLVTPLDEVEINKLMRIQVVQQAAKEVLASTALTNLNIGIMRFSSNGDGGMVLQPTLPLSENLTETNTILDNLTASNGTPIEESLYEAYLYMSGQTVDHGASSKSKDYVANLDIYDENYRSSNNNVPTTILNNNAYKQETNNKSVSSSQTGGKYIAPGFNGCEPNSKIVLFSDGDPSGDSEENNIENLIRNMPIPTEKSSYISRNCNSGDNKDGECAEELAYYMANTDHRPNIPGVQTIQVDTMGGFLGGNDGLQTYLENIASAGNGTFYPVDNYQSMVDNFRSAITDILDKPSTFTSPAIAVSSYNSLEISDELYYAVFEPTDNGAWRGNLKRYRISSYGVVDSEDSFAIDPNSGYFLESAKSFWSEQPDGAIVTDGGAAARLGDQPRKLYTLVDGVLKSQTAETLSSMSDELLGLDQFDGLSNTLDLVSGLTYKTRLINWIMGKNDNGTPRLEIEDPVHSRPVVINYSNDKRIVFVGTNSGYLHAFDTDTGREVFSIIPQELIGNPHFYKSPEYLSNDIKIYGIDGPITYWHNDINLDGAVDSGESVYLYVGLRRGGHSYYALDITSPENPALLWQKHGPYTLAHHNKNIPAVSTGYERMGQTWSSLKPAMIKWGGDTKVVLIAGGGYDPSEDGTTTSGPTSRQSNIVGNTVYIIDAITGNVLWDAYSDLPSTQGTMTNAISADVAPIDRDADGLVDLIYATDVGGRVWRFDLNQKGQGFATGGVIADLNSSDTSGISGNRRFYNRPDIAYIKKPGDPFVLISIGSGYRAHPLNQDISDSLFLIKDTNGLNGSPDSYVTIVKSDLADWTSSQSVYVDPETGEKDYQVNAPNGWYLDMTGIGEKILAPTLTLDGIITANSFAPTSDLDAAQCSGNLGRSYTYQLLVIPERYDEIVCDDGSDNCKPNIPGEEPTPGDPVDRLKPDPTIVMPPPKPCDENEEECEPIDCEDYKINILSGTTVTSGGLDRCSLFDTNYWEEER